MATMYNSNSRYALTDSGKEADRKSLPTSVMYTTYMAKNGDTFEKLAYRLFGDFTRYWEIADINPHIKFPNEIPVGTVVRVPR